MTDNAPFVTPADASQELLPFGAYRRTLGTTDHMMLLEVYVPRETVVPEHSHMHEQVGYLISGKMEFTVGGVTHTLIPGDSYAVPGNVLHSGRAVVDSVLVEVFSPPREEFRSR